MWWKILIFVFIFVSIMIYYLLDFINIFATKLIADILSKKRKSDYEIEYVPLSTIIQELKISNVGNKSRLSKIVCDFLIFKESQVKPAISDVSCTRRKVLSLIYEKELCTASARSEL